MKLKIKNDSTRQFYVTPTGYTITKDDWIEVDPKAPGVQHLLTKNDVLVHGYDKEKATVKYVVAKFVEKMEDVTMKEEKIKDSHVPTQQETFKAVVNDEVVEKSEPVKEEEKDENINEA